MMLARAPPVPAAPEAWETLVLVGGSAWHWVQALAVSAQRGTLPVPLPTRWASWAPTPPAVVAVWPVVSALVALLTAPMGDALMVLTVRVTAVSARSPW